MNGQRNRNTPEERIDKWMLFFLESLKILTGELEQKYIVFKQKGGYMNDRQKMLKEFIIANKTVKAVDLSAAFPDISLNTLKKDLRYLRDEQLVTTVGKGKGTVYIIKDFALST
jgi:Fic family protein